MCTAKELITYLQTLPEDTKVLVLHEYSRHYELQTRRDDLDIEKYSDNCELLGNTLYLGED